MEDDQKAPSGLWQAVTRARTPINIFALAMMACAATLGLAAVQIDTALALTAFTYTLHVFLAVAGMFFVTLLFSPRSMYHPQDLAEQSEKAQQFGPERPLLAALLIGVMIAGYALYQWDARKQTLNATSSLSAPLPTHELAGKPD